MQNQEKDDGFISLFNGKDLTHWNTTGNWIPQKDGSLLIQPKRGQKGWQRYSDYLISKEKFGDFILKLEYKYPPKGNSGIFFRIGDPEQPVKTGIECQILDSSGKPDDQMGHHDHGGLSAQSVPSGTCPKSRGNGTRLPSIARVTT